MPVVYADVVWLVNAIMDAVILLTSCWVLKAPVRWWRICSGGVFGACYALLLFVPSLSTLTTWPGKAVAELIMVAVAIPARNWLQLIRACVTYYLVAFVFAGAAIALHFAVPGTSVAAGSWSASRHLEYSTSLEGLALLVALPTGYGLLRFTLRRADRVLQTTTSLRSVRATFANHQVQFTGLVDTGNQLRDPLSRRPVCLVDATVMRQLLPPALAEALTEADDVVRALEHCASLPHAERLALVPYRGRAVSSGWRWRCVQMRWRLR
ncbi:sporulation sigma-E factor-processing peptidase [Alicyclobacillus contaminans]|nr:sporulation sigma-E factor-processing peptidase [Alicyclobacillus contaminans]